MIHVVPSVVDEGSVAVVDEGSVAVVDEGSVAAVDEGSVVPVVCKEEFSLGDVPAVDLLLVWFLKMRIKFRPFRSSSGLASW